MDSKLPSEKTQMKSESINKDDSDCHRAYGFWFFLLLVLLSVPTQTRHYLKEALKGATNVTKCVPGSVFIVGVDAAALIYLHSADQTIFKPEYASRGERGRARWTGVCGGT